MLGNNWIKPSNSVAIIDVLSIRLNLKMNTTKLIIPRKILGIKIVKIPGKGSLYRVK